MRHSVENEIDLSAVAAMRSVSTRYASSVKVVAASVPFGMDLEGCFKSPTSYCTRCTVTALLYTTRCAKQSPNVTSYIIRVRELSNTSCFNCHLIPWLRVK